MSMYIYAVLGFSVPVVSLGHIILMGCGNTVDYGGANHWVAHCI